MGTLRSTVTSIINVFTYVLFHIEILLIAKHVLESEDKRANKDCAQNNIDPITFMKQEGLWNEYDVLINGR